jgi:hypothetical protein
VSLLNIHMINTDTITDKFAHASGYSKASTGAIRPGTKKMSTAALKSMHGVAQKKAIEKSQVHKEKDLFISDEAER